MLPTSFHDVTSFMEVAIATWRSIFDAAGESMRLNGEVLTHDKIRISLTTNAPGKELLDALEVLHELGTDVGRNLLEQAAADRQAALNTTDEEPARELAARVWIRSRNDTVFAEVLVRARVSSIPAHARTYREFVGKNSTDGTIDENQLKLAVTKWCEENKKSDVIEIYSYQRDSEWYCEVLRGDPIKRVVEIRDKRPSILNFQPGMSDLIRYDPKTGRIGIATRAPRRLQMYREILGSMLANDVEFFAGENICTLRPLQENGRELFERHRLPGILRVDVVELRWRRGDRDNILVQGRDCFQILQDLGAQLHEGELIEATLHIFFAGSGRRGHVSIKVQNRIDIKAGAHEHVVEQFLDNCGIRGVFGDDGEHRNFWSLYPWRMLETAWRRQIGADFDRLSQRKTLRPVSLATATHPDHPAAIGALNVEPIDVTTSIGISNDPAIGLRSLTPSDYLGYELDIAILMQEIKTLLQVEDTSTEISSGIWFLGRRSLSSSVILGIFLVLRKPTDDIAKRIRDTCQSARPVLLVPHNCMCALDLPWVRCRLPHGPYNMLIGDIVKHLELQNEVDPHLWLTDDLILDCNRGIAWLRGIQLTGLKADTHPFKFAMKVAQSKGCVVTKAALNALLSPASDDDSVAKTAKSDFIKTAKASFKAIGRDLPDELANIFVSRSGGYALNGTAYVISST